ncbi:MoaD/ThiS family protein [Stappia indica]|uniref:MoaD/ThiS family protein n=1 Tax=Stappia indica TaxID=538381 RepID=UPI001CD3FEC0|nr:MoaD/ThiS family protein [Stappia indica]MCA1299583.1 MoaD/ThiS family protein [Stappia indica]
MKIRFYSWLKTRTGCEEETITLPETVTTIEGLTGLLAERHQDAAELFRMPQALRYVVDRRYVEPSHGISSADEIEIYPPVTGG